ncbi:MAG: hypothetical protein V1860_04045 [bacterium]
MKNFLSIHNFIKAITFIIIVSICAASFACITAPAKNANADSGDMFQDMQDEGLKIIGGTAYGSEKPQNSVMAIIAEFIKLVLSFLGLIFVILLLYAGFLWMTAAGNEDQVAKAKSIFSNGIMGLIIVLSAYAITYFVLEKIIYATTRVAAPK